MSKLVADAYEQGSAAPNTREQPGVYCGDVAQPNNCECQDLNQEVENGIYNKTKQISQLPLALIFQVLVVPKDARRLVIYIAPVEVVYKPSDNGSC
jgi:hypothetical protein